MAEAPGSRPGGRTEHSREPVGQGRSTMTSMVGAAVVRKEDPNLLVGRGTYVDNLRLPGMLHLAFARSVEPHARLLGVDVSAALAVPGVVGAYTAADFPDLPSMGGPAPGLERPTLAT